MTKNGVKIETQEKQKEVIVTCYDNKGQVKSKIKDEHIALQLKKTEEKLLPYERK